MQTGARKSQERPVRAHRTSALRRPCPHAHGTASRECVRAAQRPLIGPWTPCSAGMAVKGLGGRAFNWEKGGQHSPVARPPSKKKGTIDGPPNSYRD